MNAPRFSRVSHPLASVHDGGDVDLWVHEPQARDALQALQGTFPLGPYRSRQQSSSLRDLAHALNSLGCYAYRSFGEQMVRVLSLSGHRIHDERILRAIADFIPEGCQVIFGNANGTKTEWAFTGNGIVVATIEPLRPRHLVLGGHAQLQAPAQALE